MYTFVHASLCKPISLQSCQVNFLLCVFPQQPVIHTQVEQQEMSSEIYFLYNCITGVLNPWPPHIFNAARVCTF